MKGAQILQPLRLYAPTILTVVIDDWSRGMDSSFSFHDARERFWGQVAWIAEYCRGVLPSVSTVKMAIREEDRPTGEVQSLSSEESIAPAGPFLLHPYRPWDRLLEESNSSRSQVFILKQCDQVYRHIRISDELQVAIVKVVCLIYEKGNGDAHWAFDEVNELWPCASLQPGPWVWYNMNDQG